MPGERAKRPEFCPWIYHDGQIVYLEFDGMVLPFPLSEGGLAKALRHIPNVTKLYIDSGKPLTCGNGGRQRVPGKPKQPKVKVTRKGDVSISDEEAKTLSGLLEGLKEKGK